MVQLNVDPDAHVDGSYRSVDVQSQTGVNTVIGAAPESTLAPSSRRRTLVSDTLLTAVKSAKLVATREARLEAVALPVLDTMRPSLKLKSLEDTSTGALGASRR